MKNKIISIALILVIMIIINERISSDQIFKSNEFIQSELTADRLQFMPVTGDFRNYFILQSFENAINILIGDFTGTEKIISLIKDNNGDGSVDEVCEYYPDSKKIITSLKPSTPLFKGIEETKRDIILGEIFTINYAYKMSSLPLLRAKLKTGKDIFRAKHGYSVKIYDPDAPTTIMAEYFFGKKDNKYDLIFVTYYYKLYKTKITPPIIYSVYCKESTDKYVASIVEELLKLVQQ